jgi:hypothetical protein
MQVKSICKVCNKICETICKICKQYAGFDDIALYCMQYAKYAKKYARYAKYANVIFNMQNMHCPLC